MCAGGVLSTTFNATRKHQRLTGEFACTTALQIPLKRRAATLGIGAQRELILNLLRSVRVCAHSHGQDRKEKGGIGVAFEEVFCAIKTRSPETL